MIFFIRLVTLSLAVFVVSAEAKNIKYEFTDMNSNSGYVYYPRLDLNSAKSVIVNVVKNPPLFETQLSSVEITFPNAAKMTATNFKLVGGNTFRAVVNGAWIFKEVIVELDAFSLEPRRNSAVNVYVSERTAFINPQAEAVSPDTLLFSVRGMVRDITPIRIVDNASLLIAGKKVTLSLRDRPQVNPAPWNGSSRPDGFVVDVLWYGRGTKSVYLEAPIPYPEFDSVEVIALVINGTTDIDRTISVKFKDRHGFEMTSQPVQLQPLLDQTYGSILP